MDNPEKNYIYVRTSEKVETVTDNDNEIQKINDQITKSNYILNKVQYVEYSFRANDPPITNLHCLNHNYEATEDGHPTVDATKNIIIHIDKYLFIMW